MNIRYFHVTQADISTLTIWAEYREGQKRYKAAIHVPRRKLDRMPLPLLYLRDEYRRLRQMIQRLTTTKETT
jgi:hypothetical protein